MVSNTRLPSSTVDTMQALLLQHPLAIIHCEAHDVQWAGCQEIVQALSHSLSPCTAVEGPAPISRALKNYVGGKQSQWYPLGTETPAEAPAGCQGGGGAL